MTGQEIRARVIGELCGEILPPPDANFPLACPDTWPERLAQAAHAVATRLRQWEKSAADPERAPKRLDDLRAAVARGKALALEFQAAVDARVQAHA